MLFCYAARSLSPFVCPPRNHSQLVLQYRRQLNDFLDSTFLSMVRTVVAISFSDFCYMGTAIC
ncbi:hypothetical protein ACS0TY_006909 [Phlomoides rotata]